MRSVLMRSAAGKTFSIRQRIFALALALLVLAAVVLIVFIRDYAERGGQVFISTHSPDFLNALTLDEIYCLHKDQGFTSISCAGDSENLRALFNAGDLPGYLWKQGLFEGLNKDTG